MSQPAALANLNIRVFTQSGPEGDIAVRKSGVSVERPKVPLRRSAKCVTV